MIIVYKPIPTGEDWGVDTRRIYHEGTWYHGAKVPKNGKKQNDLPYSVRYRALQAVESTMVYRGFWAKNGLDLVIID